MTAALIFAALICGFLTWEVIEFVRFILIQKSDGRDKK